MARHGSLLTASGTLKIKNARFREDPRPLEEDCDCPACARYCRAWLHHLFRIQEATAWRLLSLHNVRFYKRLMARIRQAIQDGTLAELNATVLSWTRRDAACEDAGEREAD